MREISNHFCLIRPGSISDALKMNDQPHIPSTAIGFHCTRQCSFSQDSQGTDAGICWKMHFKAVTNRADLMKWNGGRAAIGIYLSDGSVRIIGTADEYPELKVTPHPGGTYVLDAVFDSTKPLLL